MDIQKEIEAMTATVSASNAAGLNVKPMTFIERVNRWFRLRSLPKNQRLLHYGFPVVSGKQLADRLGVTAFNLVNGFEDIVIKHCLKKHGHDRSECEITEVRVWANIGRGCCEWTRLGKRYHEIENISFPSVEPKASVKLEPVNSYCREIIPDRCLDHIRIAKQNGLSLKKMAVAYPIVEEVKRPDPIVVYPVNGIDGPDGLYLEITMWE